MSSFFHGQAGQLARLLPLTYSRPQLSLPWSLAWNSCVLTNEADPMLLHQENVAPAQFHNRVRMAFSSRKYSAGAPQPSQRNISFAICVSVSDKLGCPLNQWQWLCPAGTCQRIQAWNLCSVLLKAHENKWYFRKKLFEVPCLEIYTIYSYCNLVPRKSLFHLINCHVLFYQENGNIKHICALVKMCLKVYSVFNYKNSLQY